MGPRSSNYFRDLFSARDTWIYSGKTAIHVEFISSKLDYRSSSLEMEKSPDGEAMSPDAGVEPPQ